MELPYIPVTSPERQMDIVADFCRAWNAPIIIAHQAQEMVMMPYAYYMEHLCTQGEAARVEEELQKHRKTDDILEGCVCDKCQNYLGKEIENYILAKTPFGFWRTIAGTVNKK